MFEFVFRSELPVGLQPISIVDKVIEAEKESRPPHHRFSQLFPAEQNATEGHVENLQKKRKAKSRTSYATALVSVVNKNRLGSVVDYWALNTITKRSFTLSLEENDMLGCIENAKLSSSMVLKTSFNHIGTKFKDMNQTEFNKKYCHLNYVDVLRRTIKHLRHISFYWTTWCMPALTSLALYIYEITYFFGMKYKGATSIVIFFSSTG